MNIYEVVSEPLTEVVCEDWFNQACHEEPYCIAHLVAANNPSQARYLAWKTDNDFTYDLTEMPAFNVHICMKDINEEQACIVTREEKYQRCWRQSEAKEE